VIAIGQHDIPVEQPDSLADRSIRYRSVCRSARSPGKHKPQDRGPARILPHSIDRHRSARAAHPGRRRARFPLLTSIVVSDFLEFLAESLLQFTLIWYFLTNNRDPEWIALLNAAVYLPLAAGGLFSGLFVQRIGARRLLLVSKGAAASANLLIVLLFIDGMLSLTVLVVLALATYSCIALALTAHAGCIRAFARWAGVRLMTYNALRAGAIIVAPLLGVSSAGLLADRYGALVVLAIACGISFLSFLITLLSFPRSRTGAGMRLTLASWVDLTRRTLTAIRASDMSMSTFALCAGLFATEITFSGMIIPLEVQAHGMSATTLSEVGIAGSSLAAIGALLAPSAQSRVSFARLVAASGLVFCMTFLAVAAQRDCSRLSLLLAVATPGFVLGILSPVFMTNLQRSIPVTLVAHGVGLAGSLPMFLSPLLMVIAGATMAGHREETLVGMALAMLAATIAMWPQRVRRGS